MDGTNETRRALLRAGIGLAAGVALAGCASGRGEKGEEKKDEEKKEGLAEPDVNPAEDLMREHGVLNRILIIYDEAARRLEAGEDYRPGTLGAAAGIVAHFIEDYHEKQEEELIFPRFEKDPTLGPLVATLRAQHAVGRKLTAGFIEVRSTPPLKDPKARGDLAARLRSFVRMYRAHETREDTVLFPALHGIMNEKEWDELGDDMEEREHHVVGEKGFEATVKTVAEYEKDFGLDDLARFTPPA